MCYVRLLLSIDVRLQAEPINDDIRSLKGFSYYYGILPDPSIPRRKVAQSTDVQGAAAKLH